MNARRVPGYELLEVLQESGPVAVYLARNDATGALVTLETLSASLFPSRSKADRWIDEIRSLRRLQHPHLARVLDTARNGVFWVAREWVPGISLASMLDSDWPFESAHALQIGATLADVLAYLHRSEKFHGNVNPDNIFIDTDGRMRLTGLGSVVALDPDHNHYLAPELSAGASLGKAADMFALGRILQHLVYATPEWERPDAGRPPAERRVLTALTHALTAPDPKARPRCTSAVAETLHTLYQRLLPPPEPTPDYDEVVDMAQAVAELGLPLTVYRTSASSRRRETRRSVVAAAVAPAAKERRGLGNLLQAARRGILRTQ